jgi:hypothetical protein
MSDISNMELMTEIVSYDPEAEYNPPSVVPDDNYIVTLALGKGGINAKKAKSSGKPYLDANIQATVQNPGGKWDGFHISGFYNSVVFTSGASAIHQLLKAAGAQPPSSCTLGELATLLTNTLAGSPTVQVRTRWEGSVKNSDGAEKDYIRVRGMRNFTQRADGNYDPYVKVQLADGSTATVEAKVVMVDFQPAPNGASAGA